MEGDKTTMNWFQIQDQNKKKAKVYGMENSLWGTEDGMIVRVSTVKGVTIGIDRMYELGTRIITEGKPGWEGRLPGLYPVLPRLTDGSVFSVQKVVVVGHAARFTGRLQIVVEDDE